MFMHTKGIIALADWIASCEKELSEACMNGNTMRQVRANEKILDYKHAFALVTGTAVSGMHFESLLKDAADRTGVFNDGK